MENFHTRIAALRLAAATLNTLIGQAETLYRDGYVRDAERLAALAVAEVDRHLEDARPAPPSSRPFSSSDVLPF